MKEIVNAGDAPAAIGPYNHAVKVNEMLFCSGQIGIEKGSGELVTESIEEETRQALRNVAAILRVESLDYEDVIKCSIFVTDMGDYGAINSVYARYFPEEIAPARELVEVAALPAGARIEISVIAVLKN